MEFFVVDCFAEGRYQGNQLAVFLTGGWSGTPEMQAIAREANFSEVAFLDPARQADGSFAARIFTPDVEVPFAGHPTLGLAHVVREQVEPGYDPIVLDLPCGKVPVRDEGGMLVMRQGRPEFGEEVAPHELARVLSLPPKTVDAHMPAQLVSTGLPAYIVPLADAGALSRCRIDHAAFARFHEGHCKCNVLAYVWSDGALRVRVFMDDERYREDAATGSACGCLAAYLVEHGETGTIEHVVRQGEEMGRPSLLRIRAWREDDGIAVEVGGRAVTVARGIWPA